MERYAECLAVALIAASALNAAEAKLPPPAAIKIDFDQHVRPIMAAKCFSCHGIVAQAGLRLDRRQTALRGGDYGPVIVPGESANSKLIKRLVGSDGGLRMPPTGPLDPEEIGILRAWIDQGAVFGETRDIERPSKPVRPALTKLFALIRAHKQAAVKAQITADPGLVQETDASGATALHYAAGFGTGAIMQDLLAAGAKATAVNLFNSTPLHWAVSDASRVKLLLDAGADVNARTRDGRAPLFLAASQSARNEVVELLLSRGADPNTKLMIGRTPLMAAAASGNVEVMRMLLARKADPMAVAGTGNNALFDAAGSGNPEAVRLLLEAGVPAAGANKVGVTPLGVASVSGATEIGRLLIDHGADVNHAEMLGYTPLMLASASEAQPADLVKFLLAKGASKEGTAEGETLLTLAARRGDSEIARLLDVPEALRHTPRVDTGETGSAESRPVSPAITKALTLVAKQSPIFIRTGGCNSCHNQDLPSAAAALARERGIAAPRKIARLSDATVEKSWDRLMNHQFITLSSVAYEMLEKIWNHEPSSLYTDAAVYLFKAYQRSDGHWPWSGGLAPAGGASRRPPLGSDPFFATAMGIRTLQVYTPEADRADSDRRIARAAAWLEAARPVTSQDRAFHLLGLVWSGARPPAIDRAVREITANQRDDGGWSQLASMGSDAYATGQLLYALQVAGKTASDPTIKQGVKYLLRTQATDGSWHVKSRSIPLQPYFDAGFPYGTDQWISVAGTSWAAMALSMTVEPARISRR